MAPSAPCVFGAPLRPEAVRQSFPYPVLPMPRE